MSTLFKTYRKYALGGIPEDPNKFGNAAIAGAGIGTGLIDAFDQPNQYGNQSSAGMIAKSTLGMAASGAAIGGPVGAAIGGGLGLVTGFIGAGKARREEQAAEQRIRSMKDANERNASNARIAGNPSLVQGYRNAQMFAIGGPIGIPANASQTALSVPAQASADNDTLPSYFNYIRSTQNKNPEGQAAALKHIRDVRGPGMATSMEFLGRSMGTASIGDIAKRNVNTADPQMNLLYRTINENPNIIDSFDYYTEHPKADLAKHAYGGTMEAPLTKAYMQGGQAKPLSSGTTEIDGNTHAEGGVKMPQLGAEVEDGETTSGNFVFSKELGFAKLHKPIAKAMGIIEKKPQTPERVTAINLLKNQENKLALTQEYLKKSQGIR